MLCAQESKVKVLKIAFVGIAVLVARAGMEA